MGQPCQVCRACIGASEVWLYNRNHGGETYSTSECELSLALRCYRCFQRSLKVLGELTFLQDRPSAGSCGWCLPRCSFGHGSVHAARRAERAVAGGCAFPFCGRGVRRLPDGESAWHCSQHHQPEAHVGTEHHGDAFGAFRFLRLGFAENPARGRRHAHLDRAGVRDPFVPAPFERPSGSSSGLPSPSPSAGSCSL